MPVWSVWGNINPNSESWSWSWNWNVVLQLVVTIVLLGLGLGLGFGFLQLVVTIVLLGLGFLQLLRSHLLFFSSSSSSAMEESVSHKCAVCSRPSSKQCSRCKSLRYCSTTCQTQHWKLEHKRKCQPPKLKSLLPPSTHNYASSIPTPNLVDKVLFPYDQFLILFNSDRDKQLFPPCGLVNCGNNCFANVVLQCLSHTLPLVAYLLDQGHAKGCRRNQWCFLCELQLHMERACRCRLPFSPITILSRLPTIGGNLSNGTQEDAHEFMRFAIDKMQSVCLDEHGGEKAIHPKSQQTTLIQHIFGGLLQSQVVCAQCNQVSRQYENMMDLTVEIQGDATSLEECLDQFTMKEWLHGDNLYKCDRCNDYVRAWKRLTIHQAPNTLTIALKRFQSGRFGKINKMITFPENLDLSPYMGKGADGTDIYKLYAVVVHLDMLNASFFGHYICYTKGFQGEWYMIDDCKVTRVELDEVLSQGAYMLMYSRVSARATCLKTYESVAKEKLKDKADSAASHGSVEGLGVISTVSALENGSDTNRAQTWNAHCGNGDSDVQHSCEACDSSGSSTLGLHASCSTSTSEDNAPIAATDSMSLEETSDGRIIMNGVAGCAREIVKQGYGSGNEACVRGSGKDENMAVEEEGRETSGREETSCCRSVKDVFM